MKWMKKLTALLLAFLMIPVSAFIVQAEPVDVAAVPELGILQKLGVLQESDTDKDADGLMSRAEFAEIVVKLAAADDVARAFYNTRYSYDVDASYYETAYINAALAFGVMENTEESYFNPLTAVSYAEAARAMVKLLGYDSRMKQETEEGFLVMANSLKLLKNVNQNADGTISRGSVYQLLVNSLDIEVLEALAIQDGMLLHYAGGKNLLSLYHDVYTETAIIEATQHGTIDGSEVAARGTIRAGGEKYYCDAYATEYLGYNVKLYYQDDEVNKTVIYAAPWRNEVLTVDAENITNYADREYTFYDEDDDLETETTYGKKVLYNGSSAEGIHFTAKPEQGSVTFIDNDSDGTYEIVSIKDYLDYIVAGIDADNNKIYVKYNDPLEFDRDCKIRVINASSGKEESLASLANGDVITVLMNADKSQVNIYTGAEKISGQVTEKYVEGTKTFVVIDEKPYTYSKVFTDAVASKKATDLTVGSNYTYLLNYFDKIAAVENNTNYMTDYTYGIAVAGKTGVGLDESVQIKIMSALGIYEILQVKENCIVDDIKIAKPIDVLEKFYYDGEKPEEATNGTSFVPQVIRFKVDQEGRLSHVDLAGVKNPAKEALYLVDKKYVGLPNSDKNDYYQYNSAYRSLCHFGSGNRPVYPLGSKTTYLKAPIDLTTDTLQVNDELYGIAEVNNLGKNMRLYKHNVNEMEIEMLLVATQTNADGSEKIAIGATTSVNIFLGTLQAVDKEGNPVTRVRYSANGTEEFLDLAENVNLNAVSTTNDGPAHAIKPGDIFRYSANDKNQIAKIEVLWHYSPDATSGTMGKFLGNTQNSATGTPVEANATTIKVSYSEGTALDAFFVDKVQGDYIRMSKVHPSGLEDLTGNNLLNNIYSLYTKRNSVLANAIVYDAEKNKVSKATASEIREYISVGNDCTRCLLWRDDGDPRKLILFK